MPDETNQNSENWLKRKESMVGSLGRPRFMPPPSKRDQKQAKNLVFVDQLDTQNDEEQQRLFDNPSNPVDINYGSTVLDSESRPLHPIEPVQLSPLAGTTSSKELKRLFVNSIPLSITFFLQYSLNMSSLFSVGHLGKIELSAVSLGAMTASVTGIAFIQGMSTCLDTLCCQAFGAGRPDLVGLYFQKGVLVVLLGLFPILTIWYRADLILSYIVSSKDEGTEQLVDLATKYLRVMILGMPGFTLFECGKRFMQAQGNFHASTVILVICAPINIFLTYHLVWHSTIGLGFVGAPIAIAITNNLMALFLFLYVAFVDGKQCWNGFTWKVFKNWGPLVQLAIPGLIMIESEFLGYEIMTLASSYLGTNELATQTILSSITSLTFEVPFALGCAASARVASYLGAGLPDSAKVVTKVGIYMGVGLASIDALLVFVFRYKLASLFSSDPKLISDAAKLIPLTALMHFFDATGAVLSGILRGQGRQRICGYINLIGYYLIGVPIGLFLCFGPKMMGLVGIWIGFICALMFVLSSNFAAIQTGDWKKYSLTAQSRS